VQQLQGNEVIEAGEPELRLALGRARISRAHWAQPTEALSCFKEYRIYLCLAPGFIDGSICFRDLWGPHQFEPIGEIFMLPPGHVIHAKGVSDHHYMLVACEFEPEAVHDWFGNELNLVDHHLRATLNIENPNIRGSLLRLADEMCNPSFAGAAICELLAAQVMVDLARHCNAAFDLKPDGGLAAWRLKLIDERLGDVATPVTLSDLAQHCRLSVRQLTRGFRASRGCSIGEYIEQKRVNHAKRLLGTDASIKEISYSLGFASVANFSTAFRRIVGESPRQFREQIMRFS